MKKKLKKKLPAAVLMIAMIFSMAACGNNDGGQGDAEGGADPINVISREDGSGTRGAFVELMGVMTDDVDHTTLQAEITQSTSVVMTTVAGNENTIGYISLGSLDDSVKAIRVDGTKPSAETVKTGEYAVARPFEVVTNDATTDLAADFISYIMSGEGQAVIEEEGYISTAEASPAYEEKSGLSGKIVLAGSTSVAPVMQVLADSYKAIYSGVEIEIQQTGSGAGITSTIEKACDIGISSRKLKPEELEQNLTETTIAMDGIAVIVNKANAIDSLTSEQIRQIFTGEVTDWSEVR